MTERHQEQMGSFTVQPQTYELYLVREEFPNGTGTLSSCELCGHVLSKRTGLVRWSVVDSINNKPNPLYSSLHFKFTVCTEHAEQFEEAMRLVLAELDNPLVTNRPSDEFRQGLKKHGIPMIAQHIYTGIQPTK